MYQALPPGNPSDRSDAARVARIAVWLNRFLNGHKATITDNAPRYAFCLMVYNLDDGPMCAQFVSSGRERGDMMAALRETLARLEAGMGQGNDASNDSHNKL